MQELLYLILHRLVANHFCSRPSVQAGNMYINNSLENQAYNSFITNLWWNGSHQTHGSLIANIGKLALRPERI